MNVTLLFHYTIKNQYKLQLTMITILLNSILAHELRLQVIIIKEYIIQLEVNIGRFVCFSGKYKSISFGVKIKQTNNNMNI